VRVAALRTNYPYVKDAVVQFAQVCFHALEWPLVGWITARIAPRFAVQKILQMSSSPSTAVTCSHSARLRSSPESARS
jgi:hypothetical protein